MGCCPTLECQGKGGNLRSKYALNLTVAAKGLRGLKNVVPSLKNGVFQQTKRYG